MFIEIQDIYAKIPEYQKFTSVLVQTPTHRVNMKLHSENMKNLLNLADFLVFIVQQNPEKCSRDPDLLAEALPIVLVADNRPPLAVMSICLQNSPRPRNSGFFFDLFRHEILHGLGYGLIIDKSKLTEKKSEKYIWHGANNQKIPSIRHFLDFDELSLKAAKIHFNCQNMAGVQADGELKNHLNEYIFGNELMTTHLEPHGNVFSWISVGIIERTFNGEKQWYHINGTFISTEANQYSYGKKFGCEFLENSCEDFLKIAEKHKIGLKLAPFCRKSLCYKLPGNAQIFKFTDKNCENRRVIGDNQKWCPMAKNLPLNYEISPCLPVGLNGP